MSNWQEILKSVDYPTTAVVLDFESYWDSECNLKKLSILEYLAHPKFELFGVGIDELKQPFQEPHPAFWTLYEERITRLQKEYGNDLEHCAVVGQNLMFDCMILKFFFGVVPKYTVDILNLARYEDARRHNRLEDLCKIYKTSVQKGNNEQFKNKTFSEIDLVALAEYNRSDMIAETELLYLLLPKLENYAKVELPLQTHTLRMYLNTCFNFDFALANELISAMKNELKKSLLNVAWVTTYSRQPLLKTVNSDNLFVTILQGLLPPEEKIPMKQGKNGMIPELAKTDTGFQYLLNHPVKKVKDLCQTRLAAGSWPTHIKRIESMAAQAKVRDGKLGNPMRYYAAHTGRFGGTERINLQNLAGTGRAGQGAHPLLQQIRQLLMATKGHILGIGDFAQIEARITAWIAGQDDLVQAFAAGEDIYSQFATVLFGHIVRKPAEHDSPETIKRMKIERGFGKDAILGCGYGMGAIKFYDRCRANSDLQPLFDSGEYDFDFIEKLIKNYRKTYSKIPAFWTTIEKAFRWVVKYPQEKITMPRFFRLWNEKHTIHLQLPSGRVLFYPYSSINKNGELLWRWGKLWGGSITENIVQAIARDLFAEAILRLESKGFRVIHHSHDEIIVSLNKMFNTKSSLKAMENTMCVVPQWATGLPVEVETELSERYKK